MAELVYTIEKVMARTGEPLEARASEAMRAVLAQLGCVVGTVHLMDPDSCMLKLVCQQGLPEVLLDKVAVIPIGKGMAGLAAEWRKPVQVCNLQTDDSGVAKPGAKLTGMKGSISTPMIVEGAVVGVLGVAKPVDYDYSPAEEELLLSAAHAMGRAFLSET